VDLQEKVVDLFGKGKPPGGGGFPNGKRPLRGGGGGFLIVGSVRMPFNAP